MKRDRRWIWIILGILVVLLAGWIFSRWWNRDVVSIKVGAVARGSIEQVVSASGFVDAPVYELGTKFGSKVAVLNVREGQKVSKGMTLLEFDDTTRIVAPAGGLVAKVNYDE